MLSRTTLDIIAVIGVVIAAIGVFFEVYNSPDNMNEASGFNEINNTVINNNIVNYSIVVAPSDSLNGSTISSESSLTSLDSKEMMESSDREQTPVGKPSANDIGTENIGEPKSDMILPNIKQPPATSDTPTETKELRDTDEYDIGEYVPGHGYYLTNQYERDSLPPDCAKRSVANYCISPDYCINCLGECSAPGTNIDGNGVTYACSKGKWMIS